jgi:chromosome partitioning protein
MKLPVLAFFNNKGGVGKTTLAYHLAWMFSDLGISTLACDLDPQANFTAAFLNEDEMEALWDGEGSTIYRSIEPLLEGTGDLKPAQASKRADHLHLLPGDLDLSKFEDELAGSWGACLDGKVRDFRVVSALWRVIQQAGNDAGCELAVVDLGPSLGALNRAALVACDHFVIPLAPDLFSLRGLINLGPAVDSWRRQWNERLQKRPANLELPEGRMHPLGYVVMQHALRLDRPAVAYDKWLKRIPSVYLESVLQGQQPLEDPQLAQLKHYRSLMPIAHEARKPVFHLKPADGAIGAHYQAVVAIKQDFAALALKILIEMGLI